MLAFALGLTLFASVSEDRSFVPLAEITPPGGASGIGFGHAIALSGDRLVVSAPTGDPSGSGAGAVFVYQRDPRRPRSWDLVQTLLSTNVGFGGSLALQQGTLVVGVGELRPAAPRVDV